MLQAQPTVDMPSGRFSSRQPIYFLVSALPIAFVAGLLVIRTRWPQTYSQLIREDGPLEMSQWLFYVIASIGAGVAMWRASRLKQATVAMLYLLLAVGLLVVAMEEISWGQRVFDFRTPEKLKERNTQGELSIHNIDVLQTQLHEAYMIVGLGAAFAWIVIPRSLYRALGAWSTFIVPPWWCTLYFLPVGLFYLYMGLTRHHLQYRLLELTDQELFETLLPLGFIVFACHNMRRLRPSASARSVGQRSAD